MAGKIQEIMDIGIVHVEMGRLFWFMSPMGQTQLMQRIVDNRSPVVVELNLTYARRLIYNLLAFKYTL